MISVTCGIPNFTQIHLAILKVKLADMWADVHGKVVHVLN
jgi:hypothetical protein